MRQPLCLSPATHASRAHRRQGTAIVLDVIYILIGAAFLGGCVLYAIGCDRL